MKRLIYLTLLILPAIFISAVLHNKQAEWISLFDGNSLTNWKVGKNATSIKVDSGMIIVNGPVAHLFYNGPVKEHNFKNFEFKVDVMTTPGSNSGIYFHTVYQEESWPSTGYEVQVNNSHTDWRRTGSLYGFDDVKEVYVKDNEWYTEHIIVNGKRIIVKINDKVVVDHTEPEDLQRTKGNEKRRLGSGTFAFQAHDPKSRVYYRNVMVKPLD